MDPYQDTSDWSGEPRKLSERELLEWLASFSPRHEAELRRLQWAEAEAEAKVRHDRELLEWLASISEKHERELRALECKEAEEREDRERQRRVAQAQATEEAWDASKHPHGAFPQNRGWWSPTDGSGSAAPADRDATASHSAIWHSASPTDKLAAPSGSDSFADDATPPTLFAAANGAQGAKKAAAALEDWYLPSDDKGRWLGENRGEGTFRLNTPVNVSGELVQDIEFHKGVPNLDKFALPGEVATIVLTGDRDADIRHAKEAWKNLHPGEKLPKGYTFHHDLLNMTEHIEIVHGKKTKVLVGKMPLIPNGIHQPFSTKAPRVSPRGSTKDWGLKRRIRSNSCQSSKLRSPAPERILSRVPPRRSNQAKSPRVCVRLWVVSFSGRSPWPQPDWRSWSLLIMWRRMVSAVQLRGRHRY